MGPLYEDLVGSHAIYHQIGTPQQNQWQAAKNLLALGHIFFLHTQALNRV